MKTRALQGAAKETLLKSREPLGSKHLPGCVFACKVCVFVPSILSCVCTFSGKRRRLSVAPHLSVFLVPSDRPGGVTQGEGNTKPFGVFLCHQTGQAGSHRERTEGEVLIYIFLSLFFCLTFPWVLAIIFIAGSNQHVPIPSSTNTCMTHVDYNLFPNDPLNQVLTWPRIELTTY